MKDRLYRLYTIVALLAVVGMSRPGYADSDFDYTGVFFKTFTETCMPAAYSRTPIEPTGFIELPDILAHLWLGDGPGTVWQADGNHEVFLISPADYQCYVISKSGEVADLKSKVLKSFDPSASGFVNDKFEESEDGGFSASYYQDNADGTRRRVVINARPPAEDQVQLQAMAAITVRK